MLAVVVFYYIYQKTDWVATFEKMKTANLWWLLFAFAVNLVAHFLRAYRWNMLTEPAGYKLNHRRSFYSVLTGYLVNVGTSRGGEIARCALTARSEKAPVELLIGTVVTERIIDVLLMMSFSLFCLFVQFDYIYGFFNEKIFVPITRVIPVPVLIGIGIALLAGVVLLFRRFRKKGKKTENAEAPQKETFIGRFANGLKTIFALEHPLRFIVISVLIWTCYWMSAVGISQSLDISAHLGLFGALGILVFSAIGIAIPVPGGAGVWYALALGLEQVYKMPAASANTFAIYNVAIANLIVIIAGAIGFVLLWIELNRKKA